MTNTWRRLTDRLAGKTEPEALYDGLPDHLEVPVYEWVYEALTRYGLETAVAVRLRLPSRILRDGRRAAHEIAKYRDPKDSMIPLEVVDATLACVHQALAGTGDWHEVRQASSNAALLSGVLREGGSAYTVAEDCGGLERRVDETLHGMHSKAVEAAASKSRSASDHLREAFAAAYGLKPDPSLAYSKAMKAVEAIVNPLFLSGDSEPTLGKVRAHLEQGRHKYEMAIADRTGDPAGIDSVVALVSLLWHGQRDRHAGGPTSAPVTQEAAETAVHAASTLVHLMTSGKIRKKGSSDLR